MKITSKNNQKVKDWLKLKQSKYRDASKLFLIEDMHLINEALQNNSVKEIITSTSSQYNVPTYVVTDEIMKLLTDQVTSPKAIAVCYYLEERPIEGNILILDDIQDPGNFGTIIRSAVAFNFKTIIVSKNTVKKYNSKVIRASEGMLFHINIIERNLEEFIPTLKDKYTIITTDVLHGDDIRNMPKQNIAIVIGNEGSGVHPNIANLCDKVVNISMSNTCESLNAAVCASILMYEVFNG